MFGFLKRQLGVYLPRDIKSLIRFNVTMNWDDLVRAVGEALPCVKVVDANTNVESSDGLFRRSSFDS